MGIISGVIESLLTEAISKAAPEFYRKNRGCFQLVLILTVLGGVSFLALILWIFASLEDQEKAVWKDVSVGDSLFVDDSYLGISFYKKGRKSLDEWEQRKIKYTRKDTLYFERVNNVDDKFFFKKKTSFIGLCLGLDSTATKYDGDKCIMVKPSYGITHPPKPKDRFDYETRKWETPEKNFDGFKLSKEFYVKASEITLINNDKEFQ